MTNKQSTTRSSHRKRVADLRVTSTLQNMVELDAAELKQVSGGTSNSSPNLLLHTVSGRHIKEGLLS